MSNPTSERQASRQEPAKGSTGPTGERQLSRKGLAKGSIGLIGAVAIGISCIAPDYTLTATLGTATNTVQQWTPSIVWLGLIPMLFVALGYRELNRAIPDSGTSFTWGARAIGPRFGWLTGWGLIASTIVVLASLAQIAVVFFYETIDWVVRLVAGSETFSLADLNTNSVWFNVVSVVAFTAGATWMVYRDLKLTARFQYVMVAFQLLAVFAFAVVAVVRQVTGAGSGAGLDFSWDWFNPISVITNGDLGVGALISGLTVAVFIYWGWDVVLTITEETKDSQRTPGKAASFTIVLITVYYLFISTACIMFAGVGDGPLGLNGPAIQEGENVFAVLAAPVLGSVGSILVFLAVLSSSVASLESTFVSPARTMLAMGHYGALPKAFAKTSRFATPGTATIVAGVVAAGYYAVMRPLSESVLADTVNTTAIFICFYYGLTSFAAVWYFRRQWFKSVRNCLLQLVCPGLGGLFLAFMFAHELFAAPWISGGVAAFSPDYGSGSSVGGVGLVFVLSILILLLGLGLMIWNNLKHRRFFDRATTTIPVAAGRGDGLDRHFQALTDEALDAAEAGQDFAWPQPSPPDRSDQSV
ncbi:MAG: APC family permease [Propionibacteriaceae bacterium]|jgi:amino acid transporter|nr:APC family permease [Propionibacteriaceae bacterium]